MPASSPALPPALRTLAHALCAASLLLLTAGRAEAAAPSPATPSPAATTRPADGQRPAPAGTLTPPQPSTAALPPGTLVIKTWRATPGEHFTLASAAPASTAPASPAPPR